MYSTVLFQVVWLLVASIAASPTGYHYGQKQNPFPDDVKQKTQYGFPTPLDNNSGGHQGQISPVEIVKPYREPAQKFNLRKQWKNLFQNWDESEHNGYNNNDAEKPNNYKNPNNKGNNNEDNRDGVNFDNNYQKNGDNTLFRVKPELQAPYPAIIIPMQNSLPNQNYQKKQSSPNPDLRINRGKPSMIKHAYLNDHKIIKQNFINNMLDNIIDKPERMSGDYIVIPEFVHQYHINATPGYLSKPKQDNQEKKPSLYPGLWINTGEPSLINQYLENNVEKHTGQVYDTNIGLKQNQIYDHINHDSLNNHKILKKKLSKEELDGSKFDKANHNSINNDVVDVIPEFGLKYHTPLLNSNPKKHYGERDPAHDYDTNIGLKQNQIYDHTNHDSLKNHKIPKNNLSKDKLNGSKFDKSNPTRGNNIVVDVIGLNYHTPLLNSKPKKHYGERHPAHDYDTNIGLTQNQIYDHTNHDSLKNHKIPKKNPSKYKLDSNFDKDAHISGDNDTVVDVIPELGPKYHNLLHDSKPQKDFKEPQLGHGYEFKTGFEQTHIIDYINHNNLNNHKIMNKDLGSDTLNGTNSDKANHESGDDILSEVILKGEKNRHTDNSNGSNFDNNYQKNGETTLFRDKPELHAPYTAILIPVQNFPPNQDYQEKKSSSYPDTWINRGEPSMIKHTYSNEHEIIKENFIKDTLDNTINKKDYTSGDNIGIPEFGPQYHIKVTPLYHSKQKQDYQEKIPSFYSGSGTNTGEPGLINQKWENYEGKQTGHGYDINIGLKQNQLDFQKNKFSPHLMDVKMKSEHIYKPKLGYQENKASQYATPILIPTSLKDNADEPHQITTMVPVLIEQTGPKENNYMNLDIANNGHGIAKGSLQENELVNYPVAGNNFEPTKINISFPLPGYNFPKDNYMNLDIANNGHGIAKGSLQENEPVNYPVAGNNFEPTKINISYPHPGYNFLKESNYMNLDIANNGHGIATGSLQENELVNYPVGGNNFEPTKINISYPLPGYNFPKENNYMNLDIANNGHGITRGSLQENKLVNYPVGGNNFEPTKINISYPLPGYNFPKENNYMNLDIANNGHGIAKGSLQENELVNYPVGGNNFEPTKINIPYPLPGYNFPKENNYMNLDIANNGHGITRGSLQENELVNYPVGGNNFEPTKINISYPLPGYNFPKENNYMNLDIANNGHGIAKGSLQENELVNYPVGGNNFEPTKINISYPLPGYNFPKENNYMNLDIANNGHGIAKGSLQENELVNYPVAGNNFEPTKINISYPLPGYNFPKENNYMNLDIANNGHGITRGSLQENELVNYPVGGNNFEPTKINISYPLPGYNFPKENNYMNLDIANNGHGIAKGSLQENELVNYPVGGNNFEPTKINIPYPLPGYNFPKESNYMNLDIANNGHGIATGSLQENELFNYPVAGNNFEPTKINISYPLPGYNFQAAGEHINPKKPLQFTTQSQKGYISAGTIGIKPNNQQENYSRSSTHQPIQQNDEQKASFSMLRPDALVFNPDALKFHSDSLPFSGAALVFNSDVVDLTPHKLVFYPDLQSGIKKTDVHL